ncbi:CotD family spore coat protein [Bacillus methanolicus]|nr:CotD family spore coat protein [Bacillus methanolicus]EIJ80812.1 hypothetical protein MGA3_10935 [Bacillus methanolicus MGA3]
MPHYGECPPKTFPTHYDPPQVSPSKNFVNTNIFPHVVPHIHPSHTINVNKQIFTHKHYFPHTESVVNECYEQHIMCGVPHNPCCPSSPFGF